MKITWRKGLIRVWLLLGVLWFPVSYYALDYDLYLNDLYTYQVNPSDWEDQKIVYSLARCMRHPGLRGENEAQDAFEKRCRDWAKTQHERSPYLAPLAAWFLIPTFGVFFAAILAVLIYRLLKNLFLWVYRGFAPQ